MAYFGDKCKNATLRAEHKNGTCKHIHNDDSAAALIWIGFILSMPLQIVSFIFVCWCLCMCLVACLEDSSNEVAPSRDSGSDGGFVIVPFIGCSD